jgi:hypothetical protein
MRCDQRAGGDNLRVDDDGSLRSASCMAGEVIQGARLFQGETHLAVSMEKSGGGDGAGSVSALGSGLQVVRRICYFSRLRVYEYR